jgi:hypothetical protein
MGRGLLFWRDNGYYSDEPACAFGDGLAHHPNTNTDAHASGAASCEPTECVANGHPAPSARAVCNRISLSTPVDHDPTGCCFDSGN